MRKRAMMKAPSTTGLELDGTCVDYDGLSGIRGISLHFNSAFFVKFWQI